MADPDPQESLGVTFRADKVVYVDIPGARGWGAKEANCSDHTKVMLLESPNDASILKELKKKLSDALDQIPAK